jgi:glyoxylase-like metal-dependent hydrolase (beta-lactamase superfamily II)
MSDSAFKVHALELGPMENFVYLVEDIASRRCAVVDPAWEVDRIVAKARELDLIVTDILLTHSHHDHINGIEELLNHANAEVHLLKPEYDFWQHELEKPSLHHGGDELELGETSIITGDTLFVFGCGRCDLSGGSPEDMFVTLKNMKERLPQDMLIHPGHNYSVKSCSTLGEQVEGNPFMHYEDEAAFINYRMHVHDKTRDEPYDAVSRQQLKIANLL